MPVVKLTDSQRNFLRLLKAKGEQPAKGHRVTMALYLEDIGLVKVHRDEVGNYFANITDKGLARAGVKSPIGATSDTEESRKHELRQIRVVLALEAMYQILSKVESVSKADLIVSLSNIEGMPIHGEVRHAVIDHVVLQSANEYVRSLT